MDDDFFKLSEMNEFLMEDERRGSKRPTEEIDYFADDDEEEDREEDYKYDEFFDPPPGIKPVAVEKVSQCRPSLSIYRSFIDHQWIQFWTCNNIRFTV